MFVRILNANLLSITRIELLQSLKRGVLVTPNLDHLVKLQHDREFYDLYQKAEWVVCDSKILYLCSRLLKKGIPEAIPGSSFFTAFYQYHKDNPDCRIFLLGGDGRCGAKGHGAYQCLGGARNRGGGNVSFVRF